MCKETHLFFIFIKEFKSHIFDNNIDVTWNITNHLFTP